MAVDEPRETRSGEADLFARYLDFYRRTAIEKLQAISSEEQGASRLPSGWTPLELINHLACMERRWFVWGFAGVDLIDPWRDSGGAPDGRWQLPDGAGDEEISGELRSIGRGTTELLERTSMDATAKVGGRFSEYPPTLRWICFHVLQEYARHLGHLDAAVELAGGPTGE